MFIVSADGMVQWEYPALCFSTAVYRIDFCFEFPKPNTQLRRTVMQKHRHADIPHADISRVIDLDQIDLDQIDLDQAVR